MAAEYRDPFIEEEEEEATVHTPSAAARAQTPPTSPITSPKRTRDEPTMSSETSDDNALQHPDRAPPPPPAPLDSSDLLGSLLATIPAPEDSYDALGISGAQQQHVGDEEMDFTSPTTVALQCEGRRISSSSKRAGGIEGDNGMQKGKPHTTRDTTVRAVSNGSRVRISEPCSISSLGDGSTTEESETMLPT